MNPDPRYPGCSSRIRMLIFFIHPGSRGEKGTRIRNTVYVAEAGSAGRDSDGHDTWVSCRHLATLRHVRQAISNTDPRTPRFLLYIIVFEEERGQCECLLSQVVIKSIVIEL
jgi:hypothetical protein